MHFQEVTQTPACCWPGKRQAGAPSHQAQTQGSSAQDTAQSHCKSPPPRKTWLREVGTWQQPPRERQLSLSRHVHTGPSTTSASPQGKAPPASLLRCSPHCLPQVGLSPHSPRLQWSSSVSAPGWHQNPLGSKGETVVSPQAWPASTCLFCSMSGGGEQSRGPHWPLPPWSRRRPPPLPPPCP